MIKWTTPSLKCNIPSDIEFDYILITLKQGNITFEKNINKENVIDNSFIVTFTQEETGQFDRNMMIEAQLNIISGITRLATNIVQLRISRNLHDEKIEIKPTQTENKLFEVIVSEDNTFESEVQLGYGFADMPNLNSTFILKVNGVKHDLPYRFDDYTNYGYMCENQVLNEETGKLGDGYVIQYTTNLGSSNYAFLVKNNEPIEIPLGTKLELIELI